MMQIILQSMHKYKPRVHIIKHNPRLDLSQIQSLPADGVHSFSFPETEFTTVTAYQNQQVTPSSSAEILLNTSHKQKVWAQKLSALMLDHFFNKRLTFSQIGTLKKWSDV